VWLSNLFVKYILVTQLFFCYKVTSPFNFFKIHFGTKIYFLIFQIIFHKWEREEPPNSGEERENSLLARISTTKQVKLVSTGFTR
jgi:hypothetical protein